MVLGGGREPNSNGNVLFSARIPSEYTYYHGTDNNCFTLFIDNENFIQTQPCQTCPGGYATSGIRYSDPNDIITSEELSIYEEGRSVMHAGSGLNTMGGAIRLGELTSPNTDIIRHTLKISFPGHQYLYYDHATYLSLYNHVNNYYIYT